MGLSDQELGPVPGTSGFEYYCGSVMDACGWKAVVRRGDLWRDAAIVSCENAAQLPTTYKSGIFHWLRKCYLTNDFRTGLGVLRSFKRRKKIGH